MLGRRRRTVVARVRVNSTRRRSSRESPARIAGEEKWLIASSLSLAACGLARPARAPLACQVGGEGVVPGVRGMGRVGRRGPRDAAAVPRWLRTAGDEASRARRRGRGRVPGAGASRGEAVQRAVGVPAGGLGGSGGKAVNGRWSTWRAPVDFESRRLTDVAECRGFSGGDAGVRVAGATGRGTGAGRGRGGVGRCVC